MPESYNKQLIESYEELVKENEFLQAKARYFKQSAIAQDVSLNLARKQLVELKSEMRVLKASSVN